MRIHFQPFHSIIAMFQPISMDRKSKVLVGQAVRSMFGLILILTPIPSINAEETATISAGQADDSGVIVHRVTTTYQAAPTEIRVVLPQPYDPAVRYPVIYVLPVEAGRESRYGDGLQEVLKQGLHQQHAVLFVAPTFAHLPWYADHPTDLAIRQESYFVKVVVPFIDQTYSTRAERSGRWLLGFSKSGWGAWSLILRHPELFEKAAAWDAPLMLDQPGKYGSGPIFGTAENFARYHIPELLAKQSANFRGKPRLILLGYGNFRSEHERLRPVLHEHEISFIERDGPQRNHDWHSGWVSEAVQLLMEPK